MEILYIRKTTAVYALLLPLLMLFSLTSCSNGNNDSDKSVEDIIAVQGIWHGRNISLNIEENLITVNGIRRGELILVDNDAGEAVWYDEGSPEDVLPYRKVCWAPQKADYLQGDEVVFSFYDTANDAVTAQAETEPSYIATACSSIHPQLILENKGTIALSQFNSGTQRAGVLSYDLNNDVFYLGNGDGMYIYGKTWTYQDKWKDKDSAEIGSHSLVFSTDGSALSALSKLEELPTYDFNPGFNVYSDLDDLTVSSGVQKALDEVTREQDIRRAVWDSHKNIFAVVNNNTIRRYSASDNYSTTIEYTVTSSDFVNNGFGRMDLLSLRVDAEDSLYVCVDIDDEPDEDDDGYDNILCFNNSLTSIIAKWDVPEGGEGAWLFNTPIDIAFDKNGLMYILSKDHAGVRVFDRKESFPFAFINTSKDPGTEPEYLDHPMSMEIVDDILYINDAGNYRISKFEIVE